MENKTKWLLHFRPVYMFLAFAYTGWPEKNVQNFCMALCNKSAEEHVCNEQISSIVSNMSFYMYID